MALYDTSNPLQCESFKTRAEYLAKKGVVVELTEKKARRTNKQNAYLHTILAYFGCEVGETMDYVKLNYFKLYCNKDLFVREVEDERIGKTRIIRSSSDLDTGEMTTAIDRFRNWAAGEGVYLPSSEEHMFIQQMEIELSRNKQYL
jgi:hypothetical protein